MRPRTPDEAGREARRFLVPKMRGIAPATLDKHLRRTEHIARRIFERWGVGIRGWRLKHVRWFMEADTRLYSDLTRYDYWTTLRHVVEALDKIADWLPRLSGPWSRTRGRSPQLPS
jgi:hypothetical protein